MKHFEDTESLITVRDWLRFAVSRFNESKLFFGHGSDNAFDEAAYLILHTLHLPLDRLEPFLDASLTHGESEQVQAVIERRVRERLPAAYLTHEAWLGEHRFYVDERVIVPRSFIADICREVVEFGPLNMSIHKLNEHVAVENIEQLAAIYQKTLEKLLA